MKKKIDTAAASASPCADVVQEAITVEAVRSLAAEDLLKYVLKESTNQTRAIQLMPKLGLIMVIEAICNLTGKTSITAGELFKVVPRAASESLLLPMRYMDLIRYDGVTITPTRSPGLFTKVRLETDLS